ncbi:substance-K receptor-like [Euwallacea fornicatus]|uniref:substance-K receptor-like n=1 Tax=Euwallacea fornicatus TaxID=995702 RepID=UPI00338D541B
MDTFLYSTEITDVIVEGTAQSTTVNVTSVGIGEIDYENEEFPNTIWYTKGIDNILLASVIFLPICITGLVGNLWVLYVLKINQHLRTPSNLIVGNMAVADLLSTIIYPCFIFLYDYFQNYQLGSVGCKGEGSAECTILLASVISMTAITYDRLTAIVLPTDVKMDKFKAKILICCTWVVALLLSAPLTIFRDYRERIWKNFDEKYCVEQSVVVNIYWYVIITALVWLPLTIQIMCYSAIFIKLNKYEKVIVKSLNRQHLGYKRSAAKMMFIVILTFMACRLPFTAFIIYRHQMLKHNNASSQADVKNMTKGLYHSLWFSSKYLLIVNAALNPLIYSVTNLSFRNAFKKSRLSRLIFKETRQQNNVKPIYQKQKRLKSSEDTKHMNICFIFKKDLIKSTQERDTSTKVVAINNII